MGICGGEQHLHHLWCLPMPRALLRVEKDAQGTWTAVISVQHKTPHKKIEGYKCPSLEVLLLKTLLVPGWLFCFPFPVPYAQVGLLLSMLQTDPKAAGKTKNGSCLFLQSLTGLARNKALLKGFYCGSFRVWGAEEEKGAASAQSQRLKKSNRKNSFGWMKIWSEDILIFFS